MFENWSDWPGYIDPTFTPVSNRVIDYVMPRLSGAEWKVFVYILRRTLGSGQMSVDISLTEMCIGHRRGSARLDLGTGLTRPTVIQAVRGLTEKRLIGVMHAKNEDGGNASTRYHVVLQTSQRKET